MVVPPQATVLGKSKKYAEFCTMAYQMYAGRLQYAYDPFYSMYRDPEKTQEMLHEQTRAYNELATKSPVQQPVVSELDQVSYDDDDRGLDLRQPVFYSGEVYYEPPEFAGKIGRVFHGGQVVREYADKSGSEKSLDIYLFEGTTGTTKGHGGISSTMGYVAYDRETKEITVTFRGSRSGSATRAAINGLFFGTGNPDWVTDMNMAEELVSQGDLDLDGKVAEGFSSTYLSCRPKLVEIIKKIRESDPSPSSAQKLVTTGHSLGGALATMMFIDTKTGTLGRELKEAFGGRSDGFVDGLLGAAECFAFSTPPVCDGAVVKQIGDQSAAYHRVFFDNDPVVTAGNMLRIFRGSGLFEHKELLQNIVSSSDIHLGSFTGGRYFGCPHELYLVHEKIQQQLGIPVKRYWYTIENMMITHASKKIDPIQITKEQAATIVDQFNYEYFLAFTLEMAERESRSSGKTELMGYVGEIGELFRSIDPCKDESEFEKFKTELSKVVEKLKGTISNEEKSWLKYPHKTKEVLIKLLEVIYAILSIAVEFFKGLIEWLTKKVNTKQEDKESLKLRDSICEINNCCSELMTDMIMPFSEFLESSNESADLQRRASSYSKSLTKGLVELEKKFNEFTESIAGLKAGLKNEEFNEIFKFAKEFANSLKSCTAASADLLKEGMSPKDYEEKYQELSSATYIVLQKYIDLQSKIGVRNRKVLEGYKPDATEVAANALMIIPGLTFRLKVGVMKLVESIYDFGRAFVNLFTPARTSKNCAHATLELLSKALAHTDFKTLHDVSEKRKADAPVSTDSRSVVPDSPRP